MFSRSVRPYVLVVIVALVAALSVSAQGTGLYLPAVLRSPGSATATATGGPPPTTAVPSTTATVTRTPAPGEVVTLLDNKSDHVASNGTLHIVGELRNNGNDHLRFVKVTANLYNAGGQLLETDFTYVNLQSLAPGETSCYHVRFLSAPTNWSYYTFETPTYLTGGSPRAALAVLNDGGAVKEPFGWYEITGQVRNDAGARAEDVRPLGTLYDAGGTVIGCDYPFTTADLEPDQVSDFALQFISRDSYADVASYRLQMDGAFAE